ncbi:PTS system mannose/fructose/sorbose family transporter subunit IID [Pediococcus cellicola]|uniref:PTS system mannose fructose sorbose family IIDsubunit n=1 Tax=Pediococcus cellicola TaxID=319652 RepID=A0A0R2IJV4_9LACO|nr:PTS system mannose/fructose/sorbose family transporter subunit IID [Pediococcus cellicola]KRN65051.1 PTS system mannose fructose sorbose family IIDsubunit [Pediococcus cellicola]GEL15862.1 PTS mannose transporter subunit IID [Pediococcus cellicola]
MSKITKKLSSDEKKLIRQMYWRSFTLYSAVTPAKQGASGFEYSMLPAINRFYKNAEDKRKAMVRQMSYFNTNIAMVPFVMGIAASMEKKRSENKDFNEDSINAVKTSLMGPLAGIGDSLTWGVLRVLAGSIAISLAQGGNILAPIIYLLIFNIPVQLVRWYGGQLGYTLGSTLISDLYEKGLINIMTKAASIVGLVMVGAMTSSMVKFNLAWNLVVKGKTILKSQALLNQIFIGLLPLLITLLCFYLLKNKNVSINWLIIGAIVISIILALIGVV